MFLELENQLPQKIAIVDDSKGILTIGDIVEKSKTFFEVLQKRTLIFILADNSIESFLAYYACLNYDIVPLLISHRIDKTLLDRLIQEYHPEFLFLEKSSIEEKNQILIPGFEKYSLKQTGYLPPSMLNELAMLLPTSGSTGSPKLVRHTKRNLEFSATSVAQFFSIQPDDSAIAFLPMYYTMGLSVINSHLKAGAKVVLTNLSLTDREFWNTMKEQKISTFTGVPYSFEILDKLRFSRMELPDLRILTQGGGKLNELLFEKFAQYAKERGIQFVPTYGQTEGSARMAFLASDKVFEKKGSIGKAIPGGYLSIVDEHGEEIIFSGTETEGEMIYSGSNVTLGYAETKEDLQKGDENREFLYTGDIVRRDSEGYFFIIGRKKRFLKIFGLRVSLDEIENLVKTGFDVDCLCSGNDEKLMITITDSNLLDKVKDYISKKTGLFHGAIQVVYQESIKRNETGKVILDQ